MTTLASGAAGMRGEFTVIVTLNADPVGGVECHPADNYFFLPGNAEKTVEILLFGECADQVEKLVDGRFHQLHRTVEFVHFLDEGMFSP